MIKKINQIKNYRIFQNWQPDASFTEFSKINLLYGVNGSGKSTLCNLISDANEDKNWISGLSISVEEANGRVRNIETFDEPFWTKLRVFNRRYVQENLKFDSNDQSLATALLQLGKLNIDRENQIKVLETRKSELEAELPKKLVSLSIINNKQDKLARDTGELIGSELSGIGGRYRHRSYTAIQVRQLVTQTLPGVAIGKITENLEVINSPKFPVLVIPDQSFFTTEGLSGKIWEICNRSATSVIIKSLEENSVHASWVQQGLELHAELRSCLFCAQHFDEPRRNELNQHFSESLKVLQTDIHAILQATQVLRVNLLRIRSLLPAGVQIIPEFREEFRLQLELAETTFRELLEKFARFDELLESKRNRLFESVSLSHVATPDISLDLTNLVAVIDRHNSQVPLIEASLETRAKEVENSRVLAIQNEYLENDQLAKSIELNISKIKLELSTTLDRLNLLQNDSGDPISLAEELNTELAEMLGRRELVFKFVKDGLYEIERNGAPATFLSEGEKSVISLLYFVKSLDAANCDRAHTIVLIDDPISSMDSNFAIGISSRIWSSLVGKKGNEDKCEQLFLFTHNFEFFRSWCNHLDRMSQKLRDQQGITYLILEIRTRFKPSEASLLHREPYFLPWPIDGKLKKRIRSEYHYLFWRTAEALRKCQEEPSLENDLEAAAILPNSCRRLLEGFLSFRYPSDIGDFRGQLSNAIDSVKDEAARTRLLTFLHQYSHNEEGDTGRPINRPESVRILSSVFELINFVDEEHYRKMLEALELSDYNLTGVS